MTAINRGFLGIAAIAIAAFMVATAAGAFPLTARADQDNHHGSAHHGDGDNHTTISIVKIVDTDGKLETTGDQSAGAGFQFNVDDASVSTDENGNATVQADSGSHDVTEVPQDGFTLVSGSCVYNQGEDNADENNDHHDGHFDSEHHGVSDVQSDDNDMRDEDSDHHHHHDGNDHKSITCTFYNTPTAPACNSEASQTVVSDTNTFDTTDTHPAVILSVINNPAWTATANPVIMDPTAQWVWSDNPVATPGVDETKVFTRTFSIVGTPTGGSIDIGADNGFLLKVNGTQVADELSNEFNYASSKHYDISSDLVSGTNTIEITVKNFGIVDSTAAANPAGLVYQVNVTNNECVVPPPTDVCPNIDGNQSVVPEGYTLNSDNQCVLDTPTDVCPNIDGNQSVVPEGMHLDNENQCVADQSTPTNDSTPTGGGGGGGGGGNGPIFGGSFGGGNGPIGQVLGASTTADGLPNGCSALLTTYMRWHNKKNDTEDVKRLQGFLNDEMHAGLPVTGVFGALTDKWVRAFQKKYPNDTLTPWGLPDTTGFVYKTTQRWINLVHCKSLSIPVPTDLTPYHHEDESGTH